MKKFLLGFICGLIVAILCVVFLPSPSPNGRITNIPVEDLLATIDATLTVPHDVMLDETFALTVTVFNPYSKPIDLQTIQIDESFLEGFEIVSIEPKPEGSPDNRRQTSWTFAETVHRESPVSVKYSLRPLEEGHFTGDAQVFSSNRNIITLVADVIVSRARPTDSVSLDRQVGELAYILRDNEENRIISEGNVTVHTSDISVQKKGFGNRQLSKQIRLHGDFWLGIHIARENPEDIDGFGLFLENKSVPTFSWDWFRVVEGSRTAKLRGSGRIDFSIERSAYLAEIDKISFASDTTLRCSEKDSPDVPQNPRWICEIKKGSYIHWAS